MPDFEITVSGLTLSPGVDQTFARWSVDDPNVEGIWGTQLEIVELWSATANDRDDVSFAKVGEGINETIHYSPGLIARYYWARARTRSGEFGVWYPVSPTAGATLSATEWGTYTPAYSALSGTITSVLVTPAGLYWKMGRVVHVQFKFIVNINGTGAGALILSLPAEVSSVTTNPVFAGHRTSDNKAVTGALQSTTTAAFRLYDGTYPLGDGVGIYASGTYACVV